MGTTCCTGRGHVGGTSPEFVPTQAEQRVTQTKWLKGTLTLSSDRFRERSDVTREQCGLLCVRQGTVKFEFKLPSVHLVFRGHPTAKSEFCQAEIRQILKLSTRRNFKLRTREFCSLQIGASSTAMDALSCYTVMQKEFSKKKCHTIMLQFFKKTPKEDVVPEEDVDGPVEVEEAEEVQVDDDVLD
ncbi:hypothetical protein E2C01_073572 [Portunus trituberculatus]|uniref:Uncharacterized protein n=1 Tax=Portunus trituberculatus TaxID=210409 RepID=A0A5B7I3D3_PORTR|nr:hypothetical protein [Portunus trituberculatus]